MGLIRVNIFDNGSALSGVVVKSFSTEGGSVLNCAFVQTNPIIRVPLSIETLKGRSFYSF